VDIALLRFDASTPKYTSYRIIEIWHIVVKHQR